MKIILYAFLFYAIATFNACNPRSNKEASRTNEIENSPTNDSIFTSEYILLSPGEIFEHIFSEVSDPNPDFVNPKTNLKQYNTSTQIALNLGVYATDFIYLNQCPNKINSLEYYKIIIDLAPKINIYSGLKENFPERIRKNLSNGDSLNEISKQVYYYILEDLEQEGRKKTYSLIAGGVVIESIYLAVMNVKNNDDFIPLTESIFDQGYFLNNTYTYIGSLKTDPDISKLLIKLEELKTCFDNLPTINKKRKVRKNKNGHLSIEGGDKYKFTSEDFERLKNVAIKVRTEIISNN